MIAEDVQKFRILLVKAMDNELTPEEEKQFNAFLEQDASCREEWEDMQKLKNLTNKVQFKNPPKEVWDMYWLSVYNRLERGIAWILLSIGAVLLGSFAVYNFVIALVNDAHIPSIVRYGLIFLSIGIVALFVSVVREKLFTRKSDPYKEIER